jgi:surfeit locus 1 family protein
MKIAVIGNVLKANLVLTLLFLAVLALLIRLGFWQLSRAEQKEQLLALQALSMSQAEVDLSTLLGEVKDLRYRKTTIVGRYDQDHQYLIDNQIINGRVGYFVLTPFLLKGTGRSVLVNRGWVPLNKDRRVLPNLNIDEVENTLSGRINHFPVVGIKLEGAEIPTKNWPSVVQVVDINILSAKLGESLLPFQVELDAMMKDGYARNWKRNISMPPEKHIGYAVQWFGLAFTLTILFIGLSLKARK